jgi:hypothetical protein
VSCMNMCRCGRASSGMDLSTAKLANHLPGRD